MRNCPLALLVCFLMLAAARPAAATCADPPDSSVDWQRCNFDGVNLAGVDLTEARLREGSFIRTDLTGAVLKAVAAHRAKFINAEMADSILVDADLSRADLTKANLTGADLSGADLRSAQLYRSVLARAILTGAKLKDADLTGADLSGATWTDGKRVCREGSIGRCY